MDEIISIEAILSSYGCVKKILDRPTFHTVRELERQLAEKATEIHHPDYGNNGWAGDILTDQAFALLSTKAWKEPADPGLAPSFAKANKFDTTSTTDEYLYKGKKALYATFRNFRTAILQILKIAIPDAYKSGANALGQRGFGDDTPRQILSKLKQKYGHPSALEIRQNRLHLDDPMDRNQSIEVMLYNMEQVQLFAMAIPGGNHNFSDVQMIDAALAKLTETGIYTKAIEKWHLLNKATWLEFRMHIVEQYERMLTETQGTTAGMGGYGTALNATEGITDDGSIATLNESVAEYAGRQITLEGHHTTLSEHTNMLTRRMEAAEAAMNAMSLQFMNAPPQQAAYFTPQAPTFAYQQPAPPTQGQPYQYPPTQQQQPPIPSQIWQPAAPGSTTSRRRKKRREGGGSFVPQGGQFTQQPAQFGQSQNVYNRPWGAAPTTQQQQGGPKQTHTTKFKHFNNLFYCFSCGYDVDHEGPQCPKGHLNRHGHNPTVQRHNAHLYANASMKAAHKTLENGQGQAPGYILQGNLAKNQYTREGGWRQA
jgi:hypothetical protein